MNGYPYGHGLPLPPNQNTPMPATGAPYPAGGRPYPPYIIQQPHMLDAHNYNVPAMAPVNIPAESEHMNNGHHTVYPLQPIIINQEVVVPGSDNRYYPRSYNVCVPDEHAAPGSAPPPFRGFVPRVPMYVQEAPAHREDLFTPIQAEPEFRVNANTYGPRPDAVWAPNPSEIYNFGDMLNSLPPPPAPPLAPEVFPPAGGRKSIVIPLIRRDHSSPVESVGARAVGGPVSGPGAAEIPTVSANGPATAAVPSRLAVGAALLARERLLTVTERLSAATAAAAAQAYEASGSDDQELEAGLQALERRIDTEFKMAD